MTWGQKRTLVILLLVAAFLVGVWMLTSTERVPAKSVLVLDLNGPIEEQRPTDIWSTLAGSPVLVLHEINDALDQAKTDPRITGLVVRIGPLETGWGKLEEIHEHLMAFRASHKPSICYLSYDGIGNPEYYLASGCEQVWLVPTNPLGIHGMMAEALFLRGTLDKLKIVPDMYHIAEYKTATNELTEKKFTPAHREEVESLLNSVYNEYLTEVAQARNLDRAQFASLVAQGPFLAHAALEKKLVDRLAYWDEVQSYFRKRNGAWRPVDLAQYRPALKHFGGPKIAAVYASGLIVSGQSEESASGGTILGGDTVSAELRSARNDPSIRAIVLRVDSPGGSAVASEVIRREVELARRSKPVVVSMSDVAASGGYWISMSADKIVADPETITASIGVLSGKLNLAGFYKLLGLSTDYVATSDNATLYWDQQNFTPAQRQVIQEQLDDIYANFTRGVAEGRKLPLETVDKIAKGRVWSGEEAKSLGLVDELGGLDRAIAVAKQLAHIPAAESVQIEEFPKPKTLFQQIMERTQGQTEAPGYGAALEATMRRLAAMTATEPVRVQMPFLLTIR